MTQHPFDLLIELDTDQIYLDCAALHLARDVYQHVDINFYRAKLDALAESVAEMRPGLSAPGRYKAMRDILVDAHEFTGNVDDYYDPDNSYLNRVLDRGLGVPISLSTIWIEVGRRLKWPVAGVSFPGHFLVRFDDPERFILADPFNDGRTLSANKCRALLKDYSGGRISFTDEFLEPADTRSILARTLENLRDIYITTHDWDRLADVLRRLAAVEPGNGQHPRELADLQFKLGDVRGAYAHLTVALDRLPDGGDRIIVQGNLEKLEQAITALN